MLHQLSEDLPEEQLAQTSNVERGPFAPPRIFLDNLEFALLSIS